MIEKLVKKAQEITTSPAINSKEILRKGGNIYDLVGALTALECAEEVKKQTIVMEELLKEIKGLREDSKPKVDKEKPKKEKAKK